MLENIKHRLSTISELFGFLWKRKIWWLMPMVVVLMVFGLLLVVAGSAIGPFIYTLF